MVGYESIANKIVIGQRSAAVSTVGSFRMVALQMLLHNAPQI